MAYTADIIHSADRFRATIADLKRKSDYYPSIYIDTKQEHGIELYASTLVRINRGGVWYVVHCVESIVPNTNVNDNMLLLKLIDSVYKIQVLYIAPGLGAEVDVSQESEMERLERLYKK